MSKQTKLLIKLQPRDNPDQKAARAYKRAFRGILGRMSWKTLARIIAVKQHQNKIISEAAK